MIKELEVLSLKIPDRKDIDYNKVRDIGKEKYCVKGISCNFCDFMDRDKGKINNCIQEYIKRHCNW